MPAKPCAPGCRCGLHRQTRTAEHKARIGISIKLAQDANRRLGRPINQHPVKERRV
jgi:hypothetical protein